MATHVVMWVLPFDFNRITIEKKGDVRMAFLENDRRRQGIGS